MVQELPRPAEATATATARHHRSPLPHPTLIAAAAVTPALLADLPCGTHGRRIMPLRLASPAPAWPTAAVAAGR